MNDLRFVAMTHTNYSHSFLLNFLNQRVCKYEYELLQNEEVFSKFVILGDLELFTEVQRLIDINNGTSITLEHGIY